MTTPSLRCENGTGLRKEPIQSHIILVDEMMETQKVHGSIRGRGRSIRGGVGWWGASGVGAGGGEHQG